MKTRIGLRAVAIVASCTVAAVASASSPTVAKRPGADAAEPHAARVPLRFAIVLKDRMRVIGVPVDTDALPVETDFGVVRIPLELIAAAETESDSVSVKLRFKNGDTLTGRVLAESLTFRTAYGPVTIPVGMLAGLTAGARFPPEGADRTARATKVEPGLLSLITGGGQVVHSDDAIQFLLDGVDGREDLAPFFEAIEGGIERDAPVDGPGEAAPAGGAGFFSIPESLDPSGDRPAAPGRGGETRIP